MQLRQREVDALRVTQRGVLTPPHEHEALPHQQLSLEAARRSIAVGEIEHARHQVDLAGLQFGQGKIAQQRHHAQPQPRVFHQDLHQPGKKEELGVIARGDHEGVAARIGREGLESASCTCRSASVSGARSAEQREMGLWSRFVFSQTAGRNLPRRKLSEALAALGVTAPMALLLSHAHADHAGGVASLPGVHVWLAAEERALVEAELEHLRGVVLPAHARAMASRMVSLPFTPVPFANFDASYDVFGDGSEVVVPAFGHTPGIGRTTANTS